MDVARVYLLTLVILAIVHEIGHFLAAKSVGIPVAEFAFGIGPRLLTLLRRGDTDYTIRALPLGCLVSIVERQPEGVSSKNAMMSKPAWERAFIFLAGPAMNVLLALLILCSMGLLIGLPTHQLSNEVVEVHNDTEAARVGLRTGDRIVRSNHRPLVKGSELIEAIESHAGERVMLTVERQGKPFQVAARPTPETRLVPWIVIESVDANGPAAKLGLRKGDHLIALNGEPISHSLQRLQSLMDGGGSRRDSSKAALYTLTFERDGQEMVLSLKGPLRDVTLRADESPLAKHLGLQIGDRLVAVDGKRVRSREQLADLLRANAERPVVLTVERLGSPTLPPQRVPVELASADAVRTVGKMGFLPGYGFQENVGLVESVKAGWDSFLGFFVALYEQAVSGRMGKQAGRMLILALPFYIDGNLPPGYLLNLIASLSLSFAVLNLLPIPVLDGGRLLLLLAELLRRRRRGTEVHRYATGVRLVFVGNWWPLFVCLSLPFRTAEREKRSPPSPPVASA